MQWTPHLPNYSSGSPLSGKTAAGPRKNGDVAPAAAWVTPVAGFASHAVAAAATTPLHVLKVARQVSDRSVPMSAHLAWLRDGGGFRGWDLQVLRIAVRNSYCLGLHHAIMESLPQSAQDSTAVKTAVGALVGSSEAILTNPLSLATIRAQSPSHGAAVHSSLDALRMAMQTPFRGASVGLLRNGVASAARFGTLAVAGGYAKNNSGLENALVGALAGAVPTVLSNPLDVVRSAQQNGMPGSSLQVAQTVLERNGVRGLFSGCGITLATRIPESAIAWVLMRAIMDGLSPASPADAK